MPVPPDGRHPLYPNNPRHLNPVTAEIKAVPAEPRHAPQEHLPTEAIPKIDVERTQYPPTWVDKYEAAADRFEQRLHRSRIALIGLCLFLIVVIVVFAAIYVGTHI